MLDFWIITSVLASTPLAGIYGGTDFASFSVAGPSSRPDLENFIQISKKNFEVFLGSETPPPRAVPARCTSARATRSTVSKVLCCFLSQFMMSRGVVFPGFAFEGKIFINSNFTGSTPRDPIFGVVRLKTLFTNAGLDFRISAGLALMGMPRRKISKVNLL